MAATGLRMPKRWAREATQGSVLRWIDGGSDRPAVGIALALGSVFAAAILRYILGLTGHNLIIFGTFYPVILITSVVAGWRYGVLSVAAASALAALILIPDASSGRSLTDHILNAVLFAACAGFIVYLGDAFRGAVRALRKEQANNELLTNELKHRSKNTAAVICSIVRRSLAGDELTANRIEGRIHALLRLDALLDSHPEQLPTLREVLQEELGMRGAVRITGPADSQIPADLLKAIAMVTHELATNAVKYGAWSVPSGEVAVAWNVSGDAFTLDWAETGGPPVSERRTSGFGTRLIDALMTEHGGTAIFEYRIDGLKCSIVCPCRMAEDMRSDKAVAS